MRHLSCPEQSVEGKTVAEALHQVFAANPRLSGYLLDDQTLHIDDTGDLLAFGSTTVSLWVSKDQGDSWQCLSNFLPPIYVVRFDKTN